MATAIKDIISDVLVDIPTLPVPLAIRHMQKAINMFFELSEAYRADYKNMNILPQVKEYYLPLATGTRLAKPLTVTALGEKLYPTSKKLLSEEDPKYDTRQGNPTNYYPDGFSKIVVYPTPNKLGVRDLNIEVALTYLKTTTEIQDEHAEEYLEAFTHGALAGVYAIRGKEWTDLGLAQYHRNEFELKAQEAKAKANGDNLAKPRIMSYGGI